MSFQVAGENGTNGAGKPDTSGLPLLWDNLANDCCPKCSELLRAFEHLNLYKCLCGFKISAHRLEDIKLSIEQEEESRMNGAYSYGNYDDEVPF